VVATPNCDGFAQLLEDKELFSEYVPNYAGAAGNTHEQVSRGTGGWQETVPEKDGVGKGK